MITIRVYPAIQRTFDKNKLDLRMEIEFDKDPRTLKYFWLVAWRLSKKRTAEYLIFIIQHIIAGNRIFGYSLDGMRQILKDHPEYEADLDVDGNHVIIDKDVYLTLRDEDE